MRFVLGKLLTPRTLCILHLCPFIVLMLLPTFPEHLQLYIRLKSARVLSFVKHT